MTILDLKLNFDELPITIQKQLAEYADFLLSKYKKNNKKSDIKFSWEGGISELNKNFDAVSLQHKINEMR